MKAILVMEMPGSCRDCIARGLSDDCMVTYISVAENRYNKSKPEWCPLVPIPEKKMELEKREFLMGEVIQCVYVPVPENKGWNACLDAIEGSKG